MLRPLRAASRLRPWVGAPPLAPARRIRPVIVLAGRPQALSAPSRPWIEPPPSAPTRRQFPAVIVASAPPAIRLAGRATVLLGAPDAAQRPRAALITRLVLRLPHGDVVRTAVPHPGSSRPRPAILAVRPAGPPRTAYLRTLRVLAETPPPVFTSLIISSRLGSKDTVARSSAADGVTRAAAGDTGSRTGGIA